MKTLIFILAFISIASCKYGIFLGNDLFETPFLNMEHDFESMVKRSNNKGKKYV